MFFMFTVHGGKVPCPGGVWSRGGVWSQGVPGPGGWVPGPGGWVSGPGGGLVPGGCGDPPEMANAVGGTHPTGMHSCLIKIELRTGRPSPLKSYKMSAK